MTVTTLDARGKAVYGQLVDKVSTLYPLSNIFSNVGPALFPNQSIDIVTRSAISIEQASDSSGVAQTMTVQSNTPTANNLVVDQHYGAVVGIGKMSKTFDMNGAWAGQMANQILTELGDYIDQDHYDELLRVGAYSSSAALTANVAGDALTNADIEQAIAIMTSQKGVRMANLVFAFHPYGMGSVRNISAFVPHENAIYGDLGLPTIGNLHGIPVVMSQSVPTSLSVATTAAVTTGTGTIHTYTVAAGHGFVPGMLVTVTGHDADENIVTPTAITSVTATTIVVTTSATNDGTSSDATGTITCAKAMNGLIHRPWALSAQQQVPDIEVVTSETKFQDILKFDSIWGLKVLSGAMVSILSPASSVS